ncbi:MAG: hypothetical protein J07HN4v3_00152 [Halonotius sp. J07HN4]|jgi:hypothetical protein|nr:MAG: hypothetical protein J07HN4v3_00152 [Halonotius sp. J07HN4]
MTPSSETDSETAGQTDHDKGSHTHESGDGEGSHRHGSGDCKGPRRHRGGGGNGPSHSGDCDGGRRRGHARDGHGRFAETVDGEAVLSVFDAVDGPIVTSTDVADVVGISTESARRHLNELVGEGPLRRRKTGRTVVYWIAEATTDD